MTTMSKGARLANEVADHRRIENRLRALEQKLDVVLESLEDRLRPVLMSILEASKQGIGEKPPSDRWNSYWTGYADAAKGGPGYGHRPGPE